MVIDDKGVIMSLPIPDLDDKSFDDLRKEALSLIPIYSKEWTNYNPSDPGITLLELFAWLSEMVIYRLNRVPDESYINFLKLLAGAPNEKELNRLLKIPFLFKWDWDTQKKLESFRDFLKNERYIDWAEKAEIKNINGTVRAISGKNWADMTLQKDRRIAILKINGCRICYFHIDNELNVYSIPDLDERYRHLIETLNEVQKKYFFRWDNIPGNDDRILTEFLIQKFGIDWVKTAKVEKIDDGKTIQIFNEKNSLLLKLNDEKTGVSLKIDEVRTDEFIAKTENNKLNIYQKEEKPLPELKEASVGLIRSQYRVITSEDFEDKALECMERLQEGLAGRAICVNNRDLEHSSLENEKPGHVSVIIIPNWLRNSIYCRDNLNPSDLLMEEVKADLAARRLIATRVHVVVPFYQEVNLWVRIALKENTNELEVLSEAKEKLKKYFHPITGGPEGNGWPLGRNVYRSELYSILEGIKRIDHVSRVWLNGDTEVNSVEIKEYQLIALKEIKIEKVANEQ